MLKGLTSKFGLPGGGPPLEPFYPFLLIGLIAYMVSDTVITSLRDVMLPTQTPASRPAGKVKTERKRLGDYATITRRNIFNQDGEIPPALAREEEKVDDDADPVPSQLPLNLVGTIVHVAPGKSVASIQNRSRNSIISYKVDDEIEGMARIISIARKKVIFRNLNNNRKEFIEIKDDFKINFGIKAPVAKAEEKEVKQDGNRFEIKREDVLKYTNNLPELLQQARAVPNIIPNSGGQVDGFKILDIQEGSIYEQLGLKKLDILKGVNGEPLDSPAKAMEMYNALKNSQRIEIDIERNGRSETFTYSIE